MSQPETWTVGRLLTWTTDYLKRNGADSPRLDAEVLLAHARGCQRIQLYTEFETVVGDDVRTPFRDFVRRRAAGEPVAYLVGHREFYSLPFTVTPAVLIPRPETEHLVVETLDLLKHRRAGGALRDPPARACTTDAGPCRDELNTGLPSAGDGQPAGFAEPRLHSQPPEIADVGTGSGAIAVAIAKHAPLCHVTAVDVNPAALAIARTNVDRHGVTDRVALVESDLLAGLPTEQTFDFIVSNPPYVSAPEWHKLPKTVREHEPRGALVGGPTGCELIARLIPQAAQRLRPDGWLLLEISPMIEAPVRDLLAAAGLTDIRLTKDLAGLARVLRARRVLS